MIEDTMNKTPNSPPQPRLLSACLAATAAALTLFHANQAPGKIGMMGSAGVGGAAGSGGLLIDYRKVVTDMPPSSVDVLLEDDAIVFIAGSQRHRVTMDMGDLAELLTVVLDPPHENYLEVSIDRSMSAGQAIFISDEMLTSRGPPLNIGRDLVAADLAFANIVQGGEWADDPVVAKIAPVLHTAALLSGDPEYRELTQVLPSAPSTWPRVQFTVKDLNSEDPVAVTADMGLKFFNPDGHWVAPDGVVLTDKVVEQAGRPYRPLLSTLADPARRDELFARFPELKEARAYALATAGLAVFCRDQEEVCRAWQRQVSLPAPSPTSSDSMSEESFLVSVLGAELIQLGWLEVRKELAASSRDREARRSVFLDEANLSLSQNPRWDDESLLKILPVLPSSDYESRLIIRLYRAMVRLRAADRPIELHRNLRRMDRALRAIANSRLPEARRKFWAEKAANHLLVIAGHVVEKSQDLDLPARVRVTFRGDHPRTRVGRDEYASTVVARFAEVAGRTFDSCISDLSELAVSAATAPMTQDTLALRQAFVRSEQCHIPDARGPKASIIVESALHYAIGMKASTAPGGQSEAKDRLRMLRSLHAMVPADAGDELRTFVGTLIVGLSRELGGIS